MTDFENSLDWDAFRIILAIAEEGNLSAAAVKLNVNQATVGRKLKRVEQTLGVKLFDRMNNGLFSTDVGEAAIRCAKNIEEQVDIARRGLRGKDQQLAGLLRLSVPLNLMSHGLAGDINEFQTIYPDIVFQISASDAVSNFNDRGVDVAIRAENHPSNGLWGHALTTIEYSFVAHTDFLKTWNVRMLADPQHVPIPFISLHKSNPEFDENQLLDRYPNARKIATCSGMDSVLPLLETAIGTGRVASFMIPSLQNCKKLFDCDERGNRVLWILTHPDFRETKRIRLFMDFIKGRFAERQKILD